MPESPRVQRIARAMAYAVDAKGGYDGHCQTVGLLAIAVGEHLHFDAHQLAALKVGGLLHDVGKLSIPDEILLKPAALTHLEFEIVQDHPTAGHHFLRGLGLEEVSRWVLHHHERWDGGGYPSGLHGDATPIGARILGACDAYEAMTARDRPWATPLSSGDAIDELLLYSGQHFCPWTVDALVAVLHAGIKPRADMFAL